MSSNVYNTFSIIFNNNNDNIRPKISKSKCSEMPRQQTALFSDYNVASHYH